MSGMNKRRTVEGSTKDGNGNGNGNANADANANVKPYNLRALNPFNNKKSEFKRQKLDDDTIDTKNSINTINIQNTVDQEDDDDDQELEYGDGDGDGDEYSAGGHVAGPVDPYFGQRRAFPVDLSKMAVSESSEPADVAQYLAMVRVQAQRADRESLGRFLQLAGEPRVQPQPQSQSQTHPQQPDAHVVSLDGPTDGPDDNTRSETEQWKSDFLGYYKAQREEYAAYVAGREESWPPSSSPAAAVALPATFKQWKQFVFATRPDDELLYRVESGRQLMTLLVYFAKWLNKSVAPCFAEWITAALIATPEVLTGGEVSVLRGLAKKAAKQLALGGPEFQLDGASKLVMHQIIFVVGVFFGQRDLLEGTELE
ncbi:unnamed protein product [[Candida] boidinii]|uniref:Unnamed protein product n=1 Tax=Candida boidinii TaxID=5477 RepID=A0ACB5TSU9_CANBO|nr:unnamed protein product [[Candida] boidinii]